MKHRISPSISNYLQLQSCSYHLPRKKSPLMARKGVGLPGGRGPCGFISVISLKKRPLLFAGIKDLFLIYIHLCTIIVIIAMIYIVEICKNHDDNHNYNIDMYIYIQIYVNIYIHTYNYTYHISILHTVYQHVYLQNVQGSPERGACGRTPGGTCGASFLESWLLKCKLPWCFFSIGFLKIDENGMFDKFDILKMECLINLVTVGNPRINRPQQMDEHLLFPESQHSQPKQPRHRQRLGCWKFLKRDRLFPQLGSG